VERRSNPEANRLRTRLAAALTGNQAGSNSNRNRTPRRLRTNRRNRTELGKAADKLSRSNPEANRKAGNGRQGTRRLTRLGNAKCFNLAP